MRIPSSANAQKGFTLLEILIALTLFAVGLLGIAALQVRAISYNSGSNTASVATAIARGELEKILARDSGDLIFHASTEGELDLDPESAATSLEVHGAGVYSARFRIEAHHPIANMARVTVSVRTTVKGTERSVVLTGDKRFF